MDRIFLREVELEVWRDIGKELFSVSLPCASAQAVVEQVSQGEECAVRAVVRDVGQVHRRMEGGLWVLEDAILHRLVFIRRTGYETEIPMGAGKYLGAVTFDFVKRPRYHVFHQRPAGAAPPTGRASPAPPTASPAHAPAVAQDPPQPSGKATTGPRPPASPSRG